MLNISLATGTVENDVKFLMQGQEFPPAFDSHIRKIHRLLFHVLAHVYHAHFREIVLLQLHAHLNAIFAHFIELNLRFNTVEEKVSAVRSGHCILAGNRGLRFIKPERSEAVV